MKNPSVITSTVIQFSIYTMNSSDEILKSVNSWLIGFEFKIMSYGR